MQPLTDDVAVVTGGTKGIGRATAERLAADGATTVATYHEDEAAASETGAALDEYDAETATMNFDVGDHGAVDEAFDRIESEFGTPTVLVNNAGIMRNGLLLRMDPEQWSAVLETNLSGTFYCTRRVLYGMLREGGRIVNVSSIAGLRGWAGQTNYAASKAGIIGFTRSLAREVGNRDVRVNAICPGYVRTELYEEMSDEGHVDDVEDIPQERIADPEEIAEAIRFLVDPDATYVNGEVLRADGGLLA